MKKRIALGVALALVISIVGFGSAIAAPTDGVEGNSFVGHLTLFEKDPADEWPIVEDGARGQMTYSAEDYEFYFVFNGFGLEKGIDYTLIYYVDPWPGYGGACLATDTANGGGNVHMNSSAELDSFTDQKIWLVLSDDVDCDTFEMTGWTPAEYLFENNLISFTKLS